MLFRSVSVRRNWRSGVFPLVDHAVDVVADEVEEAAATSVAGLAC